LTDTRAWYLEPMKRLAVFLLWGLLAATAFAQSDQSVDNPVEVLVEIFVVSEVQGEEQFRQATTARPGQVVEYRVTAVNRGPDTLPEGIVEVLGPIPNGTTFIGNTATPSSERVLTEFSANGTDFSQEPVVIEGAQEREVAAPEDYEAIRWTLLVPMEPGQEETFVYRVTVD